MTPIYRVYANKVLLLIAAVVLSACSLSRPALTKQSFLLDATRPVGQSAAAPYPITLGVDRLRVTQPFDGRALVYRVGEHRFETDFYNEFLANPAAMLTERVTAWLTASGLFRSVVPASSSFDHRYTLEATVADFYGDYRDTAQPAAVLSARFRVARDETTQELVYDKILSERAALPSRSPEALVSGLDRALAAILSRLEQDLRGLKL